MTTDLRFTPHPSARPLAQVAAPPAMPARQPLGYPATGDYARGLADSLDAIRRNPPQTMPALGDDLLAEALLKYAQRNTAEGQAPPSAADVGGGGGFGGGHGSADGSPSDLSSTPTGALFYGEPPNLAAGPAPTDQLKPYQDASAWAAVMQRLRPQIGPNAGAGYPFGGGS
ncbi:MAG TPA: hypothetical protein VN805_08275 [Caulobacteraceae bacterium]|nr:hypothetical protein [Caulobacteraceae bacterium]